MGLGIFIARTLLQRSGAGVAFDNDRTGGARVDIVWHRAQLEVKDMELSA
jgi:two-component system sensor histidine kinase RegB